MPTKKSSAGKSSSEVRKPAKSVKRVEKPEVQVRNSPLPRTPKAAPPEVTHEMIAKRAYEISCSPEAGDELHNWLRAERELKG